MFEGSGFRALGQKTLSPLGWPAWYILSVASKVATGNGSSRITGMPPACGHVLCAHNLLGSLCSPHQVDRRLNACKGVQGPHAVEHSAQRSLQMLSRAFVNFGGFCGFEFRKLKSSHPSRLPCPFPASHHPANKRAGTHAQQHILNPKPETLSPKP